MEDTWTAPDLNIRSVVPCGSARFLPIGLVARMEFSTTLVCQRVWNNAVRPGHLSPARSIEGAVGTSRGYCSSELHTVLR